MDKAELADLITQVAKQTLDAAREGFRQDIAEGLSPIVTRLGHLENEVSSTRTELFSLRRKIDQGFDELKEEIGKVGKTEREDTFAAFGDIAKIKKSDEQRQKAISALKSE